MKRVNSLPMLVPGEVNRNSNLSKQREQYNQPRDGSGNITPVVLSRDASLDRRSSSATDRNTGNGGVSSHLEIRPSPTIGEAPRSIEVSGRNHTLTVPTSVHRSASHTERLGSSVRGRPKRQIQSSPAIVVLHAEHALETVSDP